MSSQSGSKLIRIQNILRATKIYYKVHIRTFLNQDCKAATNSFIDAE